MEKGNFRHLYGPVASWRLGRSLGIDLVPFKVCTYDCIYCQLGRTTMKTIDRKEYVPVRDVLDELKIKLEERPAPDYISLAGSGEPTLNAHMGELIAGIKHMTSIPVAVLTNGSLFWMPDVRKDLTKADLVMPSLDAGDEYTFRHINRPHPEITFEKMVEGLTQFRKEFTKPVWLEVFLLGGVTGIVPEVKKIAAITARIQPDKVHLNTVSRPPSEEYAGPVPRDELEQYRRLFACDVEVAGGKGGIAPPSLPAREISDEDILSLVRRRPCTVQGIAAGLGIHAHEAAKRLEALNRKGLVIPVREGGAVYFEAVHVT